MLKLARVAACFAVVVLACCSKPPAPKEYAYPDWRFAATFPTKPKVTDTPASADGSQPHSFLVQASSPGGYDFAVNATDASTATSSKEDMLDNAPGAVAGSMGLDIGATTDVALGTRSGRQVRFDKDGKPVMLMRFFFAYQKFYEVSATIPKNMVTDPTSLAFLNSFHLTSLEKGGPAPSNALSNGPAPLNTPSNAASNVPVTASAASNAAK